MSEWSWMVFEIVGTVAFAVSGALLGIRKQMDLFGILMLGVATAVGGGMIRDGISGNLPVLLLRDPTYGLISIAASLVVCLAHYKVSQFNQVWLLFDAIGLGAFTATGAHLAINLGMSDLFPVIVLGLITGVGGGIVRDVLAREIPLVFQREIYAIASLIGAVVFYCLNSLISVAQAMYFCFTFTVLIRLLCIKFNIHLPILPWQENK